MISKKTILNIVAKIASKIQPDRIYLVGSYAKGYANEDSDIDLLIIKDTTEPKYKRSIEIQRILKGSKLPVDIIVYTNDEFENERQKNFSFVNTAIQDAQLMYENRYWQIKSQIEKADHDLGTAILIQQHIPEYSDTLSFHCQQAVEKYIKCLLEKNSIHYKKSHDLRYLLDLLSDVIAIEDELFEDIIKLNAFGVEIRYPDIIIHLTKEETEEAVEIAKNFRIFLKNNIGFDFD